MRRTILFLHIQRTGGMSLFHRLRTPFDEAECRMFAHGLASRRDPDGLGLVEGHVSLAYARRFRRWPFVITSFRDPIERAASMYQLLREETPAQQGFVASLSAREQAARRQAMIDLTRRFTLGELVAREPEAALRFFGNNQ